jgi:hypothetical protein
MSFKNKRTDRGNLNILTQYTSQYIIKLPPLFGLWTRERYKKAGTNHSTNCLQTNLFQT